MRIRAGTLGIDFPSYTDDAVKDQTPAVGIVGRGLPRSYIETV